MTHQFPDSGLTWRQVTQKMIKGFKRQDGGCSYSSSNSMPSGSLPRVVEEIAVNRETCESLVQDGVLTDESNDLLKHVISAARGGATKQETKSKRIIIYSGVRGLVPQVALDDSTAASSTAVTSSSGSNELLWTDGNNPVTAPLVGNYFRGIHAALAESDLGYTPPDNTQSPAGCYVPGTGSGGTGTTFSLNSTGTATPGSAFWTVPSGFYCGGYFASVGIQAVLAGGNLGTTPVTSANCSQYIDPNSLNLPQCINETSAIGAFTETTAQFHNQRSLKFLGLTAFDCTADGGATIYVDTLQISARIDNDYTTFVQDYSVTGPAAQCTNYLKMFSYQTPETAN